MQLHPLIFVRGSAGLAVAFCLACGGNGTKPTAQPLDGATAGSDALDAMDAQAAEVAAETGLADATQPDASADAGLPDGATLQDAAAEVDSQADAAPLPNACTQYVAALPKPVTPGYLDYVPLRPCTPAAAAKQCNDKNVCTDDECVNGFCLHKFNAAPCNEPCGTNTGVCQEGGCGKAGTGKYWAKRFLDGSLLGVASLLTRSFVALPDGGAMLGGVNHPVFENEYNSFLMGINVQGHAKWVRSNGWGDMSARLPNGTIATARWGDGNVVALYDEVGNQIWQSSPESENQPESAPDPLCVWGGGCGTFGITPVGCDSVAYVGGAFSKFTFPNSTPTGTDPTPFIGVIGPNGKLKWRHVGVPKKDYAFGGVAEVEGGTLIAVGTPPPAWFGSGAGYKYIGATKDAFAATGFSPDGKMLWHIDLGIGTSTKGYVGGTNGIIAMTGGVALVYGNQADAVPNSEIDDNSVALVRVNAAGAVLGKSKWRLGPATKSYAKVGPYYSQLSSDFPYHAQGGGVGMLLDSSVFFAVAVTIAPDGSWVHEEPKTYPGGANVINYAAPSGADLLLQRFARDSDLERAPPSGFNCVAAQKCADIQYANCDDANPCTLDKCAPATGCVHEPKIDGSSCLDGLVCKNGNCGG